MNPVRRRVASPGVSSIGKQAIRSAAGVTVVAAGTWLAAGLLHRRRGTQSPDGRGSPRTDPCARHYRKPCEITGDSSQLARELLDVVGHSVSVMALQAGAGRQVVVTDPDRAREIMAAVESSGREAMGEIQRLDSITRSGGESHDPRPQPGLAQVREVIDAAEAAGPRVDIAVEGSLDGIPPGVSLAAYRIIEEALASSIEHGRAERIELRLLRRGGRIEISVVDDGAGIEPPGAGRPRLAAMRRRAALYDGELRARSREDDRFEIRALLPIRGSS